MPIRAYPVLQFQNRNEQLFSMSSNDFRFDRKNSSENDNDFSHRWIASVGSRFDRTIAGKLVAIQTNKRMNLFD